jgi:hypothetical protein
MRAITAALLGLSLLAPALARAQPGTSSTDPFSAPQGTVKMTSGDTYTNASSVYREAQGLCRNVNGPRQHQDCVQNLIREAEGAPRQRTPSVQVRPVETAASTTR